MSFEHRLQVGRKLSSLSTFGIGGDCLYYFEAKTSEDIRDAFSWAKSCSIPYFILGKGSNTLFHDRGFRGLVIHNKINFCTWKNQIVTVGAGNSFSLLGLKTVKKGFSGLEFAAGIPGSVGGAIYMNAGANQQETSSTLFSVDYVSSEGDFAMFRKEELSFSYRHSSFQKMQGSILSASFLLTPSKHACEKQKSILAYRKKTQPLSEKSAGCIFRNPPMISAGALIEQCNLKGYKIGGAKVSEIHANFIVNSKQASSEDVLLLIQEIQEKVYQKSNLLLETEIKRVPYEP